MVDAIVQKPVICYGSPILSIELTYQIFTTKTITRSFHVRLLFVYPLLFGEHIPAKFGFYVSVLPPSLPVIALLPRRSHF